MNHICTILKRNNKDTIALNGFTSSLRNNHIGFTIAYNGK